VNVVYNVFDLLLHSDLRIPGLVPEYSPTEASDVEIHLGEAPRAIGEIRLGLEELVYISSYKTEAGESALRVWRIGNGAFLRLDYFDGAQFWLDSEAREVWATWPAALSLEDVATYLLGPVLGLLLRMRGVPCLHASSVVFGDFAVAFVGSEGAGKSTTAAALARRGHAVVADDIVALFEREGSFYVVPAYPYLSLWPDSVEIVYGADKKLPSFSPSYNKRRLLLEENKLRFQENPLPLGAVFLLGQRDRNAAVPVIESLPPREVLIALLANSYATNLLDKNMRAREFESLGRLVTNVPIWRLRPHEDGSQISQLCDVIDERCQDLPIKQ